ncbi:FAD-dependent monooxygenase [Streptomyces caatingaensis]|uniref:Monooxygenase n=1 Tax=Streptomyces caatingaensis TaxID=1678637 RepID=A0A0K9XAT6_9ACTN|nr:FAD-dependent monooxygenase [Streptomyces caatingaensis]KNB50534.1 monooxygenase [Streptomyces caatingaensis]
MGGRPDTDVLVVGAGPVGLLLACELALAGVRTVVLERRAGAHRESRALNLHPRSLELLGMRGLAGRFLAAGRTVPGWQFTATLRRPLDFRALDTRHPYALLLAQSRTEELLARRAAELGVPVRRGHEAVALRQDADGVEADVDGPGGRTVLRAGYAAGCDGGRSLVRRAAGIGFPGTAESMTAVVGDFAVADHGANERARRHGVLVARLEAGLTRYVVMDPARLRVPSTEPVTLEEFRTSLRHVCGTDCGIGRPRWLSRFGNTTRLAGTYRRGRVLLAGDAAHVHFPVGAQGLNTGLQDAMNLGWKLAATVRGWAPPGLLDTYDGERRPVGHAVTTLTRAQTLLVELPLTAAYGEPAALLCELLDGLLGIEGANRHLAARLSGLATVYPPPQPDAHPLVGARMPDIAVTTGQGVAHVHDFLHGGGFVLLLLDGGGPPERGTAGPVTTVRARRHEEHPRLDGATEVLIRPDGRVAWATRATGHGPRAAERARALASWTGARETGAREGGP